MSHVAPTPASAHRSPAAAGARPQAAASSSSAGQAPAGLFALLLRGQQGEAEPAAEPAPESDTPAQDEARDQTTDPSSPPPAQPAAAEPAPAPPAPDWTPTVRGMAAATASTEDSGTEPVSGLVSAGRARTAGGHAASASLATQEASTDQPKDDAVAVHAGERPVREDAGQAPEPLAAAAAPEPAPEPAPAAPQAVGSLPSLGAASDTPPPAAAAPEAAPTARAHLPQPPTSPAFAPALGLQISTWLREGVQHAALELNPAELGPIDVRIALRDGQAQVALAADVPFTRQALADALPQLAQALGEVGVELAGGDVSDQAGRRARDEAATLPRLGGAGSQAGSDGTTAAPAAAARRRGLLDLYA